LNRYKRDMILHHNHYCKHCDRNFTCKLDDKCLLDWDISKLHKCQTALIYRKRMAMMLSSEQDAAPCAYGCSRLCSHPATGETESKRMVRANAPGSAVNAPSDHVAQLSASVGTVAAIERRTVASVAPSANDDHFRSNREPANRANVGERTGNERANAIIAMSKRG